MAGIFLHIFSFSAVGIFLVILLCRLISIIRRPVHLRWELAPVPHEKGRAGYGGSYLEEYEWWRKSRRISRLAPIIYMAGEILLMKGVWKHNRILWPFSLALHAGIYLVFVMFLLMLLNAILIITGASSSVVEWIGDISLVFSSAGYFLGSIGAAGLIVLRVSDTKFRSISTVTTYFRLFFLAAVFISGAYVLLASSDFVNEATVSIKGIITLDTMMSVTIPLSVHIIIALLFLVYIPMTDMMHFIAKYFTYHNVRWDDSPVNDKMVRELETLLERPVAWSAGHVNTGTGRTWGKIAGETTKNEEKT